MPPSCVLITYCTPLTSMCTSFPPHHTHWGRVELPHFTQGHQRLRKVSELAQGHIWTWFYVTQKPELVVRPGASAV